VCLRFLGITNECDQQYWQGLELMDNFVRDQMAECDSISRVIRHIEIQKNIRADAYRKLERKNQELMDVHKEYQIQK
jgi:hypothetical protein